MFDGHPMIYYFKATEFFHAACRLEEVATFGDTNWSEEIKQFAPKSSEGFVEQSHSQSLQNANQDRKCRHVAAYLFAHGLELLLKAICLQNGVERTTIHGTHKITELLKIAEPMIATSSSFKHNSVFAKKLDEVLIWAGRYPEPKETQRQHAVPIISQTSRGKTDDLVTALRDDPKYPLKPLKDFCAHVSKNARDLFFSQNSCDDQKHKPNEAQQHCYQQVALTEE
ncbi:MAG: hypothetical protein A3E84_05065 [Gammaproteobacteria bacterium RIFCSPHIGHO2_12_FULL_42_13]|nr:MAG: hypothetical protein A3E84_05065 [Gammaproteobacteria bacterium RIFCSPHIGHO2_12_FULL_42_13]